MRPLTACRMPALGEEFRRAREARGQTISDVAERLHIRSVYLTAIEDEDWAAIGAPVYIRGFMRTYARYLGLDPEAAVARLAEPPTAPAGRSGNAGSSTAAPAAAGEQRSSRGLPSAAALLAVLIAVALVGFVAYQYGQYRDQSTAVAPVAVPSPGASDSPAGAAETPVAESTPVVAPAPSPVSTRPQLGITLTETSWLRVVVDGKVAMEGTFPAGTAKTFAGKVATVRIGNAGGVRIAVDGRPVGKLGADGDVVERRFALAGE